MSLKQSAFDLKSVYGVDSDFIDTLSVGLFYTDFNGRCLYVNQKWMDITGLTFDEALGEKWAEAIHPDDRERVYSEWNESTENDQPFNSEYRFQRSDSLATWVIGQAKPYKDQDGNLVGYVGTITDITERKNIESSLRQLAKGFSVASSSEFFHSFSMHLSEVLDADYVVVSEITDNSSDSVQSVVVNHRGEILDPIEYVLKDSPCETVINNGVKGYRCDVQKEFPDFELLKALGAEGYVGSPLVDSSNKPIGIVAVLDTKPIDNIKAAEDILQIYALRASAELERKQKEEVLENLNKELEFKQFSVEHISESIFWTDKNAKIQDVNEAACQSLGYTRKVLLQLSIPDIDDNVSLEGWKNHWVKTKESGGIKFFESTHKTKDGKVFPVEINVNHIEFAGEEYHCSIVRNISERKANDRERELNFSLQNAIFEATADGLLVTNKYKYVTSYNRKFIELWDFEDKNILGESDEAIIKLTTEKLIKPDDFINRINEIHQAPEEDTFDLLELKNGSIIERVSRPQRLERKIVGRVWSFRDITEKHKLSEQLSYQATHDPLTVLVNRREFEKRLERILSSIDTESTHVVCYMDLDNFKQINDVYGHIAGDYLLKKISNLFQEQVRGRDTLARLGGDEFGLIMEHCTIEQAEKVANNFIRSINECELKWEDKEFNIGVSIGVVKINSQSVDLLEIMKKADIACYTAKKSGRNCVYVCLD
jgi:diguanylate cyclase (GGDEF)-like protein/PAS domain S-box-containing protein